MSAISAADARRAVRNAGAIAAASLLSKGILFFWQLVLARALGEAVFGIYVTVGAFISIGTSITNFGMGPIVVRDVARYPERAGQVLTATLFMQTALAGGAYAVVTGAAVLLGYDPAIQAFLALAGISLIVDILGNMTNDLLLARERMIATSAVSILQIIALVLLAVLALAVGWGLLGVYLATITAGVLRAAALWTLVWRGSMRPVFPLKRAIALPLLLNGAPLAVSAFLSLAYQHADKLMTTRLIGESSTGYLGAAFVIIFGVVEMLNTTVLVATYPLLSRYYVKDNLPAAGVEAPAGNAETFGFIVEKLAVFTLLIALPLALLLTVFAAEITVPLFGEDFRPAADVLRVLIWYAAVTMVVNVLAQALMVQNRQGRLLGMRALGLATNIGLNALLLLNIGLLGAPLASLAAELLVLLLLALTVRARGLSWRRMLGRGWRAALLACLTLGIMLAAGGVHPLLGMVAGMLVYAAGIALGGVLAADDWDLLYRLVAAMPGSRLVTRFWRRQVSINW